MVGDLVERLVVEYATGVLQPEGCATRLKREILRRLAGTAWKVRRHEGDSEDREHAGQRRGGKRAPSDEGVHHGCTRVLPTGRGKVQCAIKKVRPCRS
jgi:hypothetical protein